MCTFLHLFLSMKYVACICTVQTLTDPFLPETYKGTDWPGILPRERFHPWGWTHQLVPMSPHLQTRNLHMIDGCRLAMMYIYDTRIPLSMGSHNMPTQNNIMYRCELILEVGIHIITCLMERGVHVRGMKAEDMRTTLTTFKYEKTKVETLVAARGHRCIFITVNSIRLNVYGVMQSSTWGVTATTPLQSWNKQ